MLNLSLGFRKQISRLFWSSSEIVVLGGDLSDKTAGEVWVFCLVKVVLFGMIV